MDFRKWLCLLNAAKDNPIRIKGNNQVDFSDADLPPD